MPIRMPSSPHAKTYRLQWRNVLARHAPLRWSLAPALAVLLGALAWGGSRPEWIGCLRACAMHPLLLAVLTLSLTASAITRHRRRVQARLASSWLAALPVRTPLLAEVARLPLAASVLVLLAIGLAWAAGLASADVGQLLLPLAIASLIGFVIGWHWPRTEREMGPGSRFASVRRARGGRLRPSLLPLGYWALARTRVWGRPQITAKQVLIVLLGVPMGASAAEALAAVAVALIAWYLLSLLAAIVRVAFAAARWMLPTPIRLTRFTAALVHLAWLRQAAVCVLALIAVAALGRPALLPRGAMLALAWLVVCVVSGGAACVLAWRRRSGGGQRDG
jgi:hypothetical protein